LPAANDARVCRFIVMCPGGSSAYSRKANCGPMVAWPERRNPNAPLPHQTPVRPIQRMAPPWRIPMAPSSAARKGLQKFPVPQKTTVMLNVNGVERKLAVAPWTTLLDALRLYLDLPGTKKGLRPRPMRRLHRSPRRPAHLFMPHAGGHEGWRADHDDRRLDARKHASPVAAGLH